MTSQKSAAGGARKATALARSRWSALSCATSHVFVSAGWTDRTGSGGVATLLNELVWSP